MWNVIFNYATIKGGIDYLYVYGFFNCSDKALLLTTHNAEVVQCGSIACGGLVAIYVKVPLDVFLKLFTKCSSKCPYVLFIIV